MTSFLIFFVFALLWLHGSFLGLSDDEAYYWVLAQKPALGYAFHPPMVAWVIALFQKGLGWMMTAPSTALVRLPAAFLTASILALGLDWVRKTGLRKEYQMRAGLILLSFFGFFSLGWMMVPDLPLFFGYMLLFRGTWELCQIGVGTVTTESTPRQQWVSGILLCLGSTVLILSKYSGVLAVFSAALCLLLWAPPQRRNRGWAMLILGGLFAAIPILIWNSQHEWASILYQIRERHGSPHLSGLRYARFWAVEAILFGPIALGMGVYFLFRALSSKQQKHSLFRYLSVWILPAACVFCIQPLIADFKIHWVFVVWWPMILGLASLCEGPAWKGLRFQCLYGLTMGALVLLCCYLPIGNKLLSLKNPTQFDPRLDVTNDLYGWNLLREELQSTFREDPKAVRPVIGSRYQTASQAAFVLQGIAPVTLIPRDLKALDEWPRLNISDHQGPEWPTLLWPIYFVGDTRYDAAPEFKGADCMFWKKLDYQRAGQVVKGILLWKCLPRLSQTS